jgi:hypothetical protein
MKTFRVTASLTLITVLLLTCLSFAQNQNINALVNKFYKATDVQREQILQENLGNDYLGSGIITNVAEYDFFDTGTDFKARYYQVSTQLQKTGNIPFQLIFLYKDRDKVKDINKGDKFQAQGKILRILDERLQITIWILCGELTEKEKILFSKE